MSCPYCEINTNQFNPINQTIEYSGIDISLNRQGMLRVRVLDFADGPQTIGLLTQDIVEIKYCPLCGKKFIKD